MTNKSKRKGSAWETRLCDYLRTLHPLAERRVMGGVHDRGDVAGIAGWVIEAKNCVKVELAAWLDEAQKEALSAGVSRFAVVFPRRNKSAADAFVLMPLWLLSELMLPDEEVRREATA